MLAYDALLQANADHWFAREILQYWKRVLKRVDLTSRSLVTLVEPGSCFAGTLAELAFASDRCFMLIGELPRRQPGAAEPGAVGPQFRGLPDEQWPIAASDAGFWASRRALMRPGRHSPDC